MYSEKKQKLVNNVNTHLEHVNLHEAASFLFFSLRVEGLRTALVITEVC